MLLLRNLRQALTLREGPIPRTGSSMSDVGIIERASILIRGERIAWVGPTRAEPALERNGKARVIDCADREVIALPGFVDSHTHPVFAATRVSEYELRSRGMNYQQIAASGGGIQLSVQQARRASAEELVSTAVRYLRRFPEYGTTTIEAKSGYGLTTDDEMKILRVIARLRADTQVEIVSTFLGAHAIPPEFAAAREDYVRLVVEEMIPRVAGEGLASYCDVFCDEGYFTVDEARRILQAARQAGLGLRIHAEELSHSGGARLAAEMGLSSADHLEWIDENDIRALKRAGVIATLLPGTAFNLGLPRYPPARRLIDSGVPVALATDFNPGSSFTLNMQLVLSIACSQMKMTPAEAICAATINGACSLGLAGRLGSLEEGKQADVVLMNVADYREVPYFFGVNHCALTIRKGSIVYRGAHADHTMITEQ